MPRFIDVFRPLRPGKSAIKDGNRWEFDLRFPSHEALTAFREQITEEGIDLDVHRVSQSHQPVINAEDGLSTVQREALELAVSEGYYSIPRQTTTTELGEQLGISDQAVVKRLQQAMMSLGHEYIRASCDRPSL